MCWKILKIFKYQLLVPQAFTQVANLAVPTKISKISSFKIRKSEDWKAELAAQKATRKWRQQGCPRDMDNKYLENKKQARGNLRQAVKKHHASESITENNESMNANFRDP